MDSIKDLKKACFRFTKDTRLSSGVTVCLHSYSYLLKMTYSCTDEVIAFVDLNGHLWATPNKEGVEALLQNEGFTKSFFYIPFDRYVYPVRNMKEWDDMWLSKET